MAQDNQEQLNSIESLVNSLKSEIDTINSKVDTFIALPIKISRILDADSRDTINRVFRSNFTQVKTIVGAGFTLLPQSQYIQVSGTASRTSSTGKAIADGAWVGMMLVIEGTDNTNTVIFKDAANTNLAGDCTLGLNDTLTVFWTGTIWIELARSNN